MTIYIDYLLLVNFIFDFILLMGISVLLKRNAKLFRIILASLWGAFSIFFLFLSISGFLFFILKILSGLFMILIAFNYKDIKYTLNNLFYLMILSIIVGGFLYLINIEVGYEHIGMLFFKNGNSLNIYILILFSILILIIYIKKVKQFKIDNNLYYEVDFYINNKIIKLNGFLDTGNVLFDPYFNKPVLILNKKIDFKIDNFFYIPYKTINKDGIMKCFIVDRIFIKQIGYIDKVVIGMSNDNFILSGVDIILNKEILK